MHAMDSINTEVATATEFNEKLADYAIARRWPQRPQSAVRGALGEGIA